MLPRPSKSNRNYHPATEVDDRMYGLTSEQSELRRAVSKFAQEELAPHAERVDKDDKFDDLRNFRKKLGSLGLHGITAPEKYGVDGRPYLPGCISVLSYLEKRLMVLRDGKTFLGYPQSTDQFPNLLSKTKERIYVGSKFGDIDRALILMDKCRQTKIEGGSNGLINFLQHNEIGRDAGNHIDADPMQQTVRQNQTIFAVNS